MADLDIDAFQPFPDANGYSPTATVLRVWYNRSFIDSDGVSVQEGTGRTGFYIPVDCTIVSGVIHIPSFTIKTTLDAQDPNAPSIQCFARLYSNNTAMGWVFGGDGTSNGWQIPNPDPLTSMTKAQLAIYNQAQGLANPPSTFWTAAQIQQYFSSLSPAPDASDVTKGLVKLSKAPDSATDPIARGYNDNIFNNGNVGIGSTLADKTLDVAGVIRSRAAAAIAILDSTNATAEAGLFFQKNEVNLWAIGSKVGESTENFNLYNYTTAEVVLSANKTTGNIGIGTVLPGEKLAVAGTGVFTDTQMNILTSSNIGSLNFQAEFQTTNGAHNATPAFAAGIEVPFSATVWEAEAILGIAVCHSSTVHAVVGGTLIATAKCDNANMFGANIVAQDKNGFGLTTGVSLTGLEVIAGPQYGPSTYTGTTPLALTLGGSAVFGLTISDNTYGSAMLSIGANGGPVDAGDPTNYIQKRYAALAVQINDGLVSADGAGLGIGVRLGCVGVPTQTLLGHPISADSSRIAFNGYNSLGVLKQTYVYGDEDGNLILVPAGSGAVEAISPLDVLTNIAGERQARVTFTNESGGHGSGQLDLYSFGNPMVQLNANSASWLIGGALGIGTTTPAASALLELSSTTGALLPTRMTTAQRDALTAVDGMILYNTTTGALNYRKAGVWTAI